MSQESGGVSTTTGGTEPLGGEGGGIHPPLLHASEPTPDGPDETKHFSQLLQFVRRLSHPVVLSLVPGRHSAQSVPWLDANEIFNEPRMCDPEGGGRKRLCKMFLSVINSF